MAQTPRYTIRLPIYLRDCIKRVTGPRGEAKFIISAINEKLSKTEYQHNLNDKQLNDK